MLDDTTGGRWLRAQIDDIKTRYAASLSADDLEKLEKHAVKAASHYYAKGASGPAVAFVHEAKEEGVWLTTEIERVNRNGAVPIVTQVVPVE